MSDKNNPPKGRPSSSSPQSLPETPVKQVGGGFFSRQLPFESETNFFILANALDFFMTYVLLQTGPFRESNEVANRVLESFGIYGLIFFKFLIVAIVCILAQVIAVKQPQTAKKLLVGGTIVVFAVVAYSCYLFLKYANWGG